MRAGVDHELLRNLVLKLHVYKQENDYEGIDRRDDVVDAEFEAQWMINRNFDLHLGVRFRERDVDQSRGIDDGYRANSVTIQARGKL